MNVKYGDRSSPKAIQYAKNIESVKKFSTSARPIESVGSNRRSAGSAGIKRPSHKKSHSYYLPLETYLKKGSVNFISPYSKGTKFKDSSLAFFDLDGKEAILYDLKK